MRQKRIDNFKFIRMIQYLFNIYLRYLFNKMRYLSFDVKKNIDSYIKM